MAEGNDKGLEKHPKRDEDSDRDAASRTAPNQVSTVLMQGALTTPRPLSSARGRRSAQLAYLAPNVGCLCPGVPDIRTI